MCDLNSIQSILDQEPRFKGWRVQREIGVGRFGRVYQICNESNEGQPVYAALKWISIEPSQEEIEGLSRSGRQIENLKENYDKKKNSCMNEIEVMLDVQGESYLVDYKDCCAIPKQGGIGYDILIRMELLMPLLEYIKRNGIDEKTIIDVGRSVATALSICHYNKSGKEIIHGDVKTANIFFSRKGVFKLGDFGLAFVAGKDNDRIGGTKQYLAPECLEGENKTIHSDQYALGVVLYELLAGHTELEYKNGALVRPSNCESDLLWSIICRALQKKPYDRFSSIDEMREQLELISVEPSNNKWDVGSGEKNQSGKENTITDIHIKRAKEYEKGVLPGLGEQEEAISKQPEEEDAEDDISHEEKLRKMIAEEKERRRRERWAKARKILFRVGIALAVIAVIVVGVLYIKSKNRETDLQIVRQEELSQNTVQFVLIPGNQELTVSLNTQMDNPALASNLGQITAQHGNVQILEATYAYEQGWTICGLNPSKEVTIQIDGLLPNTNYRVLLATKDQSKEGEIKTESAPKNSLFHVESVTGRHYSGGQYEAALRNLKDGASVWSALIKNGELPLTDGYDLIISSEKLEKEEYCMQLRLGDDVHLAKADIAGMACQLVVHIDGMGTIAMEPSVCGEETCPLEVQKENDKYMMVRITDVLKETIERYPEATGHGYTIDCLLDGSLLFSITGKLLQ